MHEALILIAQAISLAQDHWRRTVGRRRPLSGEIAVLEECVQRLEAEYALLRARFLRVPGMRRPHYRRHERLEIIWHAARHGMSVSATAHAFGLTRQTLLNRPAVMRRKDAHLLPPLRGLPDLGHELVHRLKAEWPRWGTRRIAGQLGRLGVKASRTSVQRILRRPRTPRPGDRPFPTNHAGLLARRPNHVWMIDFTKVGGIVRTLWIGAVIDAHARRVLAVGAVRGAPSSAFAVRLLREAVRRNGQPRWLVTDKDPILRGDLVQRLLTHRGVLRHYGAVGRRGSIALIERTWRSMKQEYVRHLFLHRPIRALEAKLGTWQEWHNGHRPHQGLGQRTPDEVCRGRPPKRTRDLMTGGTLSIRFLGEDRRFPVLRLSRAA